MSFKLSVSFTGLCSFVPNSLAGGKPKMCVLLVDATSPGFRKALDGTDLRPHRGFVEFPISSVSPDPGKEGSLGLWYFKRQRIAFEIEEEAGAKNEFEVKDAFGPNPHPEKPSSNPVERGSFTWTAEMAQVSPSFNTIDPKALWPRPPEIIASTVDGFSLTVLAHVLLTKGKLGTEQHTARVLAFDETLSQKDYRRMVAHQVVLSLEKLTSAKLVAVDFDDPTKIRRIDLTPTSAVPEVNIRIANVCADNPLSWPIERAPVPDEDSKWYFELLSEDQKRGIKAVLRGRELPIPRPLPLETGFSGPGSTDCIPNRFLAHEFDLG